ncbi:16S rRNA (adenine(1518)-N(6)/adenine(1519)-N(6))-dimethyltransferase RsmA [Olsenella sp. HMSC062G07]|uniref:16S rRNA (adenine(1518)-N(6)/adenine(1519)-N(6))- dimethyltransferase RsmA n=1 Tax=Olsenella sp. HMSC062G07 TaxID=1739330 RepID=UPI0008A47B7B|nr:16S rRNA (adenine(1518)-N(6)/adenine(1519)-N(6))-dimethyltransferase RsmA [Olsenella sp. HMSC062G07]OFK23533.1 hypothetical protein HMPREF2826_04475 [Olsenella sp. HMSC062G07]
MAYSRLASREQAIATLRRHGLYAKHRLGQNFLVNDEVIGKILDLAQLGGEECVLEVGPGIGTLTLGLLPRAGRVIAIEADRALEPALGELADEAPGRLDLVWGDALAQVPDGVLARLGEDEAPHALVANLPYQVAATLVLQVLQTLPSVRRLVVMVQAEVADRMAARPGGRAYGAYTAKLALFGRVTGRFEVGPGNFMPPPHVDSAVLRIDRRPARDPASGACLANERVLAVTRVINAAFAQRRKTIRNNLVAGGYDPARVSESLERAAILPAARAETLAPEDFVRLAAALDRR